jgi:hypothetical protein
MFGSNIRAMIDKSALVYLHVILNHQHPEFAVLQTHIHVHVLMACVLQTGSVTPGVYKAFIGPLLFVPVH